VRLCYHNPFARHPPQIGAGTTEAFLELNQGEISRLGLIDSGRGS
jgi:hypothetical protein